MSSRPPPDSLSYTRALLNRAHSQSTTSRILAEKIQSKPLIITPTIANAKDKADARSARTARRALTARVKRGKSKTKPGSLSAKQKRALCVYELTETELDFKTYAGLHKLWCTYMRETLGLAKEGLDLDAAKRLHLAPERSGPMLAAADMHGAHVRVVRSRCVSRVGIEGIVVRETRFTVVVVTQKNQGKTVPKEGTIFRYKVALLREGLEGDVQPATFEVHGDAIMARPPERAGKKFKLHISKRV